VIQSLHEEEQGVMLGRKFPSGTGPWKAIKKLANDEMPTSQAFFKSLVVKVGEDSRIRFWKDS